MENFVTDGRRNVWRELEEYKWQLDRNKEPTDVPADGWDHAMDAGRYGIVTRSGMKKKLRVTVATGLAMEESGNPLDWV